MYILVQVWLRQDTKESILHISPNWDVKCRFLLKKINFGYCEIQRVNTVYFKLNGTLKVVSAFKTQFWMRQDIESKLRI